jgi:hypothetical protein
MRRVMIALIPLFLCLAPGCKRGVNGPPVDFKPLTAASLREKLAYWKGSVVVVDFWAFY